MMADLKDRLAKFGLSLHEDKKAAGGQLLKPLDYGSRHTDRL